VLLITTFIVVIVGFIFGVSKSGLPRHNTPSMELNDSR
jgi:hypothetical protein